jgi:quercetin dioxygenase-like cupin family protein
MRLKLSVLTLLAALAAAATASAATAPIVATPIGVGTLTSPITLTAKPGAMVVDQIKIAPGGNFGWHTHGSAVAVVVVKGTLTVFDPKVTNCAPFKVGKGAGFIEPANHIHLARNDGTTPVVLYATYLGIPKGALPNKPGTEPGGCSA